MKPATWEVCKWDGSVGLNLVWRWGGGGYKCDGLRGLYPEGEWDALVVLELDDIWLWFQPGGSNYNQELIVGKDDTP